MRLTIGEIRSRHNLQAYRVFACIRVLYTRGETVPCFSCSGTRMPALFPTVRVSVPCTLFSRPTKCIRDNYFLEKTIFTSKNETSESPSVKKIMTKELFGRVGIVR